MIRGEEDGLRHSLQLDVPSGLSVEQHKWLSSRGGFEVWCSTLHPVTPNSVMLNIRPELIVGQVPTLNFLC